MNYTDELYKLTKKLHWLKIADDGVLEIYLDNHMMQTFRMCEARGWNDFVDGYHGRGSNIWFLDFGSATHKLMEIYYENYRKPNFDIVYWSTNVARDVWTELEIDAKYFDEPDYKALGGLVGFSRLLLEYALIFGKENERFRVIGTELYFGKGKEVPLLVDPELYPFAPFRLYLCGKIDLLIDDGFNIGPMDHKTRGHFRGKNPLSDYEIQDGMTGYVFGSQKLLNVMHTADALNISSRQCNKIWMNFLQVKAEDDPRNRFKRLPLFKTESQLEDYRKRQISTVTRIFQLLSYPDQMTPFYNTMACTNFMHRVCPLQEVHRQNDKQSELTILQSNFIQKPIWNPEEVH